jgi:hypothetical protein
MYGAVLWAGTIMLISGAKKPARLKHAKFGTVQFMTAQSLSFGARTAGIGRVSLRSLNSSQRELDRDHLTLR